MDRLGSSMRRILRLTALLLCLAACASTVELKAPLVSPVYPEKLAAGRSVRIGEFEGAACFQEHVQSYLAGSGKFAVAPGGRTDDPDLVVSGKIHRIAVYSNVFDKQVLVGWYTAFIITAPLAAASYFGAGWRADAVATGEIAVLDGRAGKVIWKGAETYVVGEEGRSLPSEEAIAKAMADLACRNLATKILNRFLESLTKSP